MICARKVGTLFSFALLTTLAVAPGAPAATVSVEPEFRCSARVVFTGAPGEANSVQVGTAEAPIGALTFPPTCSASTAQLITITDAGAPVHVGPGCQAVRPHTAACLVVDFNGNGPLGPIGPGTFFELRADLGDGDDSLVKNSRLGPPYFRADVLAGTGDDDLSVQDGVFDNIACGAGSDVARADARGSLRDAVAADCEAVTWR